jgi:hypothetical protein
MNRIALAFALAALGALAFVFSNTAPLIAHGGGLDKYGCHNDRKAGCPSPKLA